MHMPSRSHDMDGQFSRVSYPEILLAVHISEPSMECPVCSFTVQLGLKDVGHMRDLARDSNCPLPLADLAFNHLLTAKALGHSNSDWGSLALASRQAAGLPLPAKPSESP